MSYGFNLSILKKSSLYFNDNADQFNDNAEHTTRTQERCQNHPYTDIRAWYYLKKQSGFQHDVSDADKHFFNMSVFTLTYNTIYPTAENRYEQKPPQTESSFCNVLDLHGLPEHLNVSAVSESCQQRAASRSVHPPSLFNCRYNHSPQTWSTSVFREVTFKSNTL